MSIRAEAWTLPGVGTFQRRRHLRFSLLDARQVINGVGQGRIVLSGEDEKLPAIIGDTVGSLIRMFDGDQEVYSFYIRNEGSVWGTNESVVLTGPGRERMLDDCIVYPYDWPTNPTKQPNWRFGGENEMFQNADFEADPYALGGGWESGTLEGWQQTTDGGDFNANSDFEVYFSAADARTGDFSIRFDPTQRHSGMYKTYAVTPNKDYEFDIYLRSPTTGRRYTFSATLGKGGWSSHTNAFVYNGLSMAELDNVARNPAANGLPGGSTDGTWQSFNLQITTGDDQTDLTLYLQYDHHDGSNGPVAYADDFSASGWGLGMDPWEARGSVNEFTVDDTNVRVGTYAAKIVVDSGSGANESGMFQEFDTIGGRAQTVGFWVYHEEGSDRDFTAVIQSPFNNQWIASNTVTVPDGVWTRVEVQGVTEGDETTGSLRYAGSGAVTFWVDTPYAYEGLGAATAGGIIQQLLDPIKNDRSHMTFLKTDSFDAVLDSEGNQWLQTLDVEIARGTSLLEVLDDLTRFGVEWRVDWNGTAGQYELKLYENERMGSDLSGTPVRFMARTVTAVEVERALGGKSVILAEGSEGVLATDEEPSLTTAFGRREKYVGTDDVFASQSLNRIIFAEKKKSDRRKVGLRIAGQVYTPKVDFDLGDRIDCFFPPNVDDPYRITSIQTTAKRGEYTYVVEVNRPIDLDYAMLSGNALPPIREPGPMWTDPIYTQRKLR